MLFGNLHHSLDAFREDPFIGGHYLAVLAIRGDAPERDVVILVYVNEILIVVNTDPGILGSVLPRDLERSIGAAIVADGVVPVWVALRQHALDAVTEMMLPVIHRGHHTHPRCRNQIHIYHHAAPMAVALSLALSPFSAISRASRDRRSGDRTCGYCCNCHCRSRPRG